VKPISLSCCLVGAIGPELGLGFGYNIGSESFDNGNECVGACEGVEDEKVEEDEEDEEVPTFPVFAATAIGLE
jgi:hypothetical protein